MSVYKKFSKEQKNYLPRIPMLIMGGVVKSVANETSG
jgi:hypothetical protein